MKRISILLLGLLLVGCNNTPLTENVTPDKFIEADTIEMFDTSSYLKSIDPLISSLDYLRLDSIFLDEEEQETVIITNQVMENILVLYNEYAEEHSTYDVINFFDLHVKKMSDMDIDILVHKIVEKVELDYQSYQGIVIEPEFIYITKDYTNRITTTYLDNYVISDEALVLYPHLEDYLQGLKEIVNGGYQIRKFGDFYYIFPDYASFLVRYDEYYTDETNDIVDVLVSNSRNIVSPENNILLDNDEIAYQIAQVEDYLKKYPNSLYYDMLRETYQSYFITILNNQENVEVLTSRGTKYRTVVVNDFKKIIDRYSNTQMSRLLNLLVENIEENDAQYDQEFLEELIIKVKASY